MFENKGLKEAMFENKGLSANRYIPSKYMKINDLILVNDSLRKCF
jgi:hypothetical protein